MEAPTSRSSLTLCILDDEPEQLNLLSEMVSELGYESLPTSDPEEGTGMERMSTSFWIACCALTRACT
jgi:CheY-like chemotaxis protein